VIAILIVLDDARGCTGADSWQPGTASLLWEKFCHLRAESCYIELFCQEGWGFESELLFDHPIQSPYFSYNDNKLAMNI
jgi:hypothetical protein